VVYEPGELPSAQSDEMDNQGRLVMSTEQRHLLVDGTTEPLSFYSFHCQHTAPPMDALCELRNAVHVSIYGMKYEIGFVSEEMNRSRGEQPSDESGNSQVRIPAIGRDLP